MRDIRPQDDAGERSIRNIPVRRRTRVAATEVRHELAVDGPEELPKRRKRGGRGRLLLWAVGVVVIFGFGGLLISTIFSGATVSVYPRTATVSLPETLLAKPNAPVGTLSYVVVSATRSASVSVPAQGTQRVSRPATGIITISNTFSSASQRLIANTRFEAADGKIYRIRDSVTVPGASGTGASMKAGTVSATIYADSAGPDYNKPAGVTFAIPGFKGQPQYTKFSATAAGGITGGFIGEEAAVAAADLSAAKTTLQQKLDAEVRSAAASEIPNDSVAIPGTLEVTFAGITQTPGEDKTATLTQNATASGVIVRQADFASAIAKSEVDQYQGEAVLFADTSSMDVSLASTSKRSDGTIAIALKGQVKLVWQFDKNAFLERLLGKNKSEFQSLVESLQPAVTKADASIRPFWRGQFPSEASKITVKIVGDK